MTDISRQAVRRSGRHSGMVRRYHTWPTIQTQTNADHTWNVIRVYWEIFGPEVPPTTLSRILWHDAGENVTGDPPFPVKRDNPDLKAACDRVERDALMQIAGEEAAPVLSDREMLRIKVCDLLEMAEFGAVEQSLGSSYGRPVTDDCLCAVREMLRDTEDWDAVWHWTVSNPLSAISSWALSAGALGYYHFMQTHGGGSNE